MSPPSPFLDNFACLSIRPNWAPIALVIIILLTLAYSWSRRWPLPDAGPPCTGCSPRRSIHFPLQPTSLNWEDYHWLVDYQGLILQSATINLAALSNIPDITKIIVGPWKVVYVAYTYTQVPSKSFASRTFLEPVLREISHKINFSNFWIFREFSLFSPIFQLWALISQLFGVVF